MGEPPPEFFEALEKYPDLENPKSLLKGDDAYSKSLLALILTRLSEDNDTQVAEMLSTIDTKDNDIAMMLCFMTYEYRLETTKGKNMILKRFGKAVPEAPEAEAPEAEAEAPEPVEAPEAVSEGPVAEPVEAPEALVEAPVAEPVEAPVAEAPEAEAVEAPEAKPNANTPINKNTNMSKANEPKANEPKAPQKGGSKKKRPLRARKTKRASRP